MELVEFLGDNIPPYAILSHTWQAKEILFKDVVGLNWKSSSLNAFRKIQGSCEQAIRDGLEWIWIDTCCIDKASSAELSEAINSMFFWYSGANVCYAYLSDVSTHNEEELRRSKWFTRGWTLQELLAPAEVTFYNSTWDNIGTKHSLSQQISDITGIDRSALEGARLDSFSVAKRMSWAATRQTTRKEDEAYCLLGLFDVNMPLLYGERGKAFLRLQQEILKSSRDQSLFAWGIPENLRTLNPSAVRDTSLGIQTKFAEEFFPELTPERLKPLHLHGFFASSPKDFLHCCNVIQIHTWSRKDDSTSPHYIGNDLRVIIPRIYLGRLWNKHLIHLNILGCYIENTQSVICLLCITPPKTNSGRIKTSVSIVMHEWGRWSAEQIWALYTPLTLSHGVIESKPNASVITIDFEQLRHTTGYHLTENRCGPKATLTAPTMLRICDDANGRYSIVLFETDNAFDDPFVIIFGIFRVVRDSHIVTRALIRVQWVPRTENILQFMEKAIAQPFITTRVQGHFLTLPDREKLKLSINADKQFVDEVVVGEEISRLAGLNNWCSDLDLSPRPGQSNFISFSLRQTALPELDHLSTEYSLKIESISFSRLSAIRVYWTTDPYDHLSMFYPCLSSQLVSQNVSGTYKALSGHADNPVMPPSEANDTEKRSLRLNSNSLNTKRKIASLLRVWPLLPSRAKRKYDWIELLARLRRQSLKSKRDRRLYSKIIARRPKYET